MGYTPVALKQRILEMYPDIEDHGIEAGVDFIRAEDTYIVRLRRGKAGLTTYLDKKDADACMDGVGCLYLGVQIGEFVRNFEERQP